MKRRDLRIAAGGAFGLMLVAAAGSWPAVAQGPSFDCSAVEPGSIEEMVCADDDLGALDRRLAEVYAAASARAVDEHPPVLKAEQRGWIKGRDDCWKSDDVRSCVEDSYRMRIAELEARYRLVQSRGPVFYTCGGQPANEVVVTYFDTEPPTAIVERGDSSWLMYLQPSASGAKYQGRNESFWEHHGEAILTWGYDGPELHCSVAKPGS